MRSSTRAYSDAGADSFRTAAVVAMESSGLLDHLLVDHLDVLSDAVAIATDGVLGHRGLVPRGQLITDLRLHLRQGRLVGRGLLHRGDEIDEVSAEKRDMALGQYLAVTGDDRCEVELLERRQGVDPVFGVAVVHERHPVDQRVAGGYDLLLRQVDEQIAVGLGAPKYVQLDLAAV